MKNNLKTNRKNKKSDPKAKANNPTPRPDERVPEIDAFRAQHLALTSHDIDTPHGRRRATIDEAESPLGWLARRKGRDGKAMIAPHQLQAGERLRADFTRAHMMPRTTSNWSSPMSSGHRGGGNGTAHFTETMMAARQRVNQALDAAGPEFSGLLLDVCCFLKGLEDLEGERGWPARSAKVVLHLALDRLARHYGYLTQATGRAGAPIRTWLAEGETFRVE